MKIMKLIKMLEAILLKLILLDFVKQKFYCLLKIFKFQFAQSLFIIFKKNNYKQQFVKLICNKKIQ